MALQGIDLIALAVLDEKARVTERCCDLIRLDEEFNELEPINPTFVESFAGALRSSFTPGAGIDPDWSQTLTALSESYESIGVVSCYLKYIVVATEEIAYRILQDTDQRSDALVKVHWTGFLGLEAVARDTAARIDREMLHCQDTTLRNKVAYRKDTEALKRQAEQDIHVIYIDMDGLKALNDSQGHDAGDAALKTLAGDLSSVMREGQTPYHFSGDEFGVISQGVAEPELKTQLEELLGAAVHKFSFGIAHWPSDNVDIAKVLKAADFRMQEHKNARKKAGLAPQRGELISPAWPSRWLDKCWRWLRSFSVTC